MSDSTVSTPEAAAAAAFGRCGRPGRATAYRGIFQRLFIWPEIGAMIGVVGIWVFFWR
jgi:hypothetical protein